MRQLEGGGLAFPVRVDGISVGNGSNNGGASTDCGSSSQVVSQDEVSADGGGSTSRSSSVASSMGGFAESLSQGGEEDGEGGGGDEGHAYAVGLELDDETFGVSLDATGGSGGGRGGSGGAGGYGLKSPDAGYDSRGSSLRCWGGSGGGDSVAGRLIQHRRDQLDLLSQLEAEGVFAADDSYSPCRVDVARDLLSLVVPIGTFELEEPGLACGVAHTAAVAAENAGAGARGVAHDACTTTTGRVKQESGTGGETNFNASAVKEELSDEALSKSLAQGLHHAPQAFMGPAVTTTAASCAAAQVFMGPMVAAAATPRAAAPAGPSSAEIASLPLESPAELPATAAGGVPPRREPGPEDAKAPTTCVVGDASTCHGGGNNASAVATGRDFVPGAADIVTGGAVAVAGAGASALPTAPVSQVGSPTAPVFVAAGAPKVPAVCASSGASTRSLGAAVGGTVATVLAGTTSRAAGGVAGTGGAAIPPNLPKAAAAEVAGARGGGRGGMLVVPPRPAKRRKSSSFPAALLQPREVRYQCFYCLESYASTVTGNPWWLLVRQECPTCHKMQIPRVDILNPTNNVEGHIALLTEACAEVS